MASIDSDTIAQRLLETLQRFPKSSWHRLSCEDYSKREIKMLFHIQWGTEQDERGVSISALSSSMEVTSPTITQLITSMERSGLVIRSYDERDRRIVRVQLTPYGRKIASQAREDLMNRFRGLVEYLGPQKTEQLTELIQEVYDYFENRCSSKAK